MRFWHNMAVPRRMQKRCGIPKEKQETSELPRGSCRLPHGQFVLPRMPGNCSAGRVRKQATPHSVINEFPTQQACRKIQVTYIRMACAVHNTVDLLVARIAVLAYTCLPHMLKATFTNQMLSISKSSHNAYKHGEQNIETRKSVIETSVIALLSEVRLQNKPTNGRSTSNN